MNILLALVAALLPAAVLLMYIWKKDTRKEPTAWLAKAVLYGVGICFPVAMCEMFVEGLLFGGHPTTLFGTTIEAFFVAALPEESFKLFVLWRLLRKNPYFDEHFDGIVYAVCVGLGFAAVENVFYVFGEDGDWLAVAATRALLAVPGHYAFAIMMGYYYSVYHFVDRSPRVAACVLLVPVVAHGIYDALALSGKVSPYVGGISFFVLIFFCVRMHRAAKSKVADLLQKDEVA